MSATYVRLDKLISFVLGTTLSALVLLGVYSYRDTLSGNKRWVAIIALSLLSAFLLWLIGAIKRFHERMVHELKASYLAEIGTWRIHADKVWRLSFTYGMAQQAQHTIDFFRRAMPKDELQYLDANINSNIHNTLGAAARDSHYEHMPQLPEEAESQGAWIRSHCWRLEKLIERERQAQLSAHTATPPKQLT